MEIYDHSNLTKAQLVFWLGQKLNPDVPLYNLGLGLIIPRTLGPDHFRRAFQRLVRNSDALRTVIEVIDGIPQQRVLDDCEYVPDYLDFSSNADPLAQFDAWAEERSQVIFDLERRLYDCVLIKLSEEKYAWYLNQHHIISDGFSFFLAIRYMSDLYENSLNGTLDEVAPFPQFSDYVAYEQSHRGERGNPEERAFWQEKLAEASDSATFYGTLATHQVGRICYHNFDLGVERSEKIQALARQDGVATKTPSAATFNILAAVLMAYLFRMSGNRRPTIGMPFHNRRTDAYKQTIGVFIGVLPLSVEIEDDDTMLSLIQKVAQETSLRLRNSPYYFHNLMHTQSPDVFLNVLFWDVPTFCGTSCETRWIPRQYGTDPFAIHFGPFVGNLEIGFDFNTSTFDDEKQQLAMEHLIQAMDAMLDKPSFPVTQIDLLAPEKRQRLAFELNQTAATFPSDKTIHQLFEAQAAHTPDAVAVVFESRRLTYGELNRRANQVAHYLRNQGVGPDAMVGLCVERSLNMVVGLLGILKAGGAYVPLDPAYPRERLAFMIGDSGTPLLLTQESLLDLLPETEARIVCLDRDWPAMSENDTVDPVNGVAPSNLAYVIYTSGSTGRPKGAMLEHRGLCNLVAAQTRCFGVTDDSRVLQFASLSFDASVSEIFMALCKGATLCLARQETIASADDLLHLLRSERITTVTLPPSVLKVLDGSELPDLGTVVAAGEICPATVVETWAPGRRFFNAYGPTETTVCASVAECREGIGPPPIGRPIANMQMYILDDAMRLVPAGVPGELYIGGVGLARGYWNREDLTQECFVGNPFSDEPDARLYRTGDRARYRADGEIEFLGRLDHQVKVRGYRIELGEIESVLKLHPDLIDGVVIAREDVPDDHRLVAYVVAKRNGRSFNGELKAYLRQSLPEYMVPSAFVLLDALPLSPNGKVDRTALPQPDRASRNVPGTVQAPRDTLELELTQIWEHVLNVRPISVTDNFFDLGGHSLSAVHLMDQIDQHFRQRLAPAVLFEAPTVEQLACMVQSRGTAKPDSVVVPIQPGGTKAPFFCVHPAPGTVFCYVPIARHVDPDRPFYGLQAPAINGVGTLFETVEETAAHYVKAIRAVCPEGPYHLGGHSSGGIIAFEMARQLRQEGHEVGVVVLLDTFSPLPRPRSKHLYDLLLDASDDAVWLASILLMVEHFSSTRIDLRFPTLRKLTRDQQYEAVLEALKRVHFLAPSAGLGAIHGLVDNCRSTMKAGMRYCPEPYAGKVAYLYTSGLFAAVPEKSFGTSMNHLWRLLKRDWRAILKGTPQLIRDMIIVVARSGKLRRFLNDPTLGWRTYVRTPIETRPVPGNHISMLAEPAAAGVAAQILECLDAADAERGQEALVEV